MSSRTYMFKLNGLRTLIGVRRLKPNDANVKNNAVRCAWCQKFVARPVVATVTRGVTVDIITCLCYCPHCELGSEYRFETPPGPDILKKIDLPMT